MEKKFREAGERLRKIRHSETQKDFSARLGVSLPALQNYEAGYRLPPGEVLTRAAAFGNTTVDWILTGSHGGHGGHDGHDGKKGLFISEGSPMFEVYERLARMPKNRQAHFREVIRLMLDDEKRK